MIRVALSYFIDILIWIIVIRSLFSWIPGLLNTSLYRFLCELTEPLEAPIRNYVMQVIPGPFDVTPVIVVFILAIIQNLL